ncbi:MFS transporter [Denitromonas iodatirespirans]|uniref:MFS transporter n=1 Tax=Denitromonas iodatirespirans TaxID=2795389 RepID=A0A944D9I2_DENI1|nr:MFS transporter [Denitromonas iodatirespirans]MBT0962459.1 MFS transporter [Denitromonas iodatirespirans]
MSAAALPRRTVLAYGVLGFPLAFAALPIYVHVPKLYADSLGLPLALVGAVLLGARVVDAVADPLIGWASDRLGGRRWLIALGLVPLALGVLALLRPPADADALWLLLALTVAYAGYSLANINYQAWGARLAPTSLDRTRVVAAREGFGLAGVVLAAALPAWLAADPAAGLGQLALIFVPVVVLAGVVTLGGARGGERGRSMASARMLAAVLRRPAFRRLLAVFAVGGIAAAVPATTVLFFVDDVIGEGQRAGMFLAAYFVAGGVSLPLWVALARRVGKLRAWLLSMGLSIVAFAWAAGLGAGDGLAFGLICVASGLALGADLSLPPAMLADQLAHGADGDGACFGWWNFATKANLALAAGVSLPLLALLGYVPGARDAQALSALAIVYAGVPVALKAVAATLLWRWRDRMGEMR